MQQRTVVLLGFVFIFIITGCSVVNGSGNVITDERSIGEFDSIRLNVDAELTIEQGERTFLTMEGDDNIIERVETIVRGDNLIIRNRDRGMMSILRTTVPLEITVSTPTVEEIDVAGSGNIFAETLSGSQMDLTISGSGDVNFERLETEDMDVTISGSGDIQVEELTADFIDVTINGSGDVKLEGDANRVDYNINGSGTIETEDLAVNDADIRVNGSGEVTVWVKESLDVRVNGSGDVRYRGSPQIDQRISGSGDIIALDEQQ